MSGGSDAGSSERYGMAPLIRFTLMSLYLALVLPLPLLAPVPLRAPLALLALPAGLLLVLALSSEQVQLDERGIRVGHPAWCAWWLRRGWQLDWSAVEALLPVVTSQGGRVFYVRSRSDGRAWLLPQRVARFEQFLSRFSQHSGLDTSSVGRISPPWTYRLLAVLCGLLLTGEAVSMLRMNLP
ncbi:MAG: hypothetical protein VKI83_01125 [Synechococcaceae cyanobacterium]|nr:hypothetical protein [Synechococcaceae cyanobacterium]